MKEINLEEILLSTVPKDCYWEEMGNLTNCPKEYALDAMKAAYKQVLELAAENATTLEDDDPDMIFYAVDRQSILNTINQVK